jgi:hypothetical protein
MRPLVAAAFGVIPGLAILLAVSPRLGLAVVALVVVSGAIWLMTRCRHPGRLGLLPPSPLPDGTRVPARWYCDQCGASWPAAIEHDTTPVMRYSGFDQSKAPAAARRAAEEERKRQALAVRRATMGDGSAPRPRPTPDPVVDNRPTVVAIGEGRRPRVSSAEVDPRSGRPASSA